jgi:hypothetical protein
LHDFLEKILKFDENSFYHLLPWRLGDGGAVAMGNGAA